MATKASVAIRREQAIASLQLATEALFGERLELPTQGRDPELVHVMQLEAIAEYLAGKVAKRERQETALEHLQAMEVAGQSEPEVASETDEGEETSEEPAPRPSGRKRG